MQRVLRCRAFALTVHGKCSNTRCESRAINSLSYVYVYIFQPLYNAHALDNNPFSSVISALGVLMTAGTLRTASYYTAIMIIIICAQTSSACAISLFLAHTIFFKVPIVYAHCTVNPMP